MGSSRRVRAHHEKQVDACSCSTWNVDGQHGRAQAPIDVARWGRQVGTCSCSTWNVDAHRERVLAQVPPGFEP
jgi:hypothetical protein